MTLLKTIRRPLMTSVLCILAVAGISSTASAATDEDCAAGYVAKVHKSNGTLQKAIQACDATTGSGISSCVHKAVDAHKKALETAHTAFEECMATAVHPTHN